MNHTMQKRVLIAAIAVFGFALFGEQSRAAAVYPDRPVRIVVPVPAGSGADIVARAIAQKLTDAWRQQVIVDNRSGANGIIGKSIVTQSKPDGYTLLYGYTLLLTRRSPANLEPNN